MSEREYLTAASWGQVLDSGRPQGELAQLDAQHAATPQRVAGARALFTEASISDFEPFGNRGKLRHRQSGVEYVVAQEQVLEARDPRRAGVEYFIVHGGVLRFLRRRGWDGNVERSIPGEIVAGVLERSPSGGVRVRDVRSGHVVRDQVRL